MDDIAMSVKGLGKRYRIGEKAEPYKTFRDAIARAAMAPFRRLDSRSRAAEVGHFWALKNVSFDVNRGEVLGVIGRNGAGKSTLLKILSRITDPTEGRAEIYGKVGSLLEVGTGFHPELTGRENIFMSGSILGMKKYEIENRFDQIVKFAETEKFLDTPLKYYSSGMQVRLGFSVAAHLEPEILIIDEVLAVGDASFQKKCLGKMENIANEGRTVLFVSHNMGAISSLTDRCIWIDHGRIKEIGPTAKVVTDYINEGYQNVTRWQAPILNSKPMQILQTEIFSDGGLFETRSSIKIVIDYVVREPVAGAVVSAIIHASDGTPIMSTEDIDTNLAEMEKRSPGKYRTTVVIPGNWLSSGKYLLRLHTGVVYESIFDNVEALCFDLIDTGDPKIRSHKQAYFLPYLDWKTEKVQ